MTTELTKSDLGADIERVIVDGDLGQLTPAQRVAYYNRTCESLGLNPLTKPLAYIKLNGKLTLYATKDATEQLRKIHSISLEIVSRIESDGALDVIVRATMPNGRKDEDVGSVPISGLKGEALSNARMKCTTKAKRRATLSICGLGFLDEIEIPSVPTAKTVNVTADGEIVETLSGKDIQAIVDAADESIGLATNVSHLRKILAAVYGDERVPDNIKENIKAKCSAKKAAIEAEAS